MPAALNLDKDFLIQKYIIERLPKNEVARLCKTDKACVTRYLKKYNIDIRSQHYRYGFNDQYFQCPNPSNSYWAGFIAADGCIHQYKTQQKRLNISIDIKDIYHLEKFKKYIGFTGPVNIVMTIKKSKHLSRWKRKKKSKMCSIRINNDNICNSLMANFNITPRKTLNLQPPYITTQDNIVSFICGYIDGDGCIKKAKNKNSLSINILGTQMVLKWIKENLEIFFNIPIRAEILELQGEKNLYYSLTFSDRELLISLFEHVNNLNIPLLKRKWDKLGDYVKHNRGIK